MKNENQEGKKSEVSSKLEGHVYDDIEELDHSLPKWWVNLFILTVIFSVGYYCYYEFGNGPSLLTEFLREKSLAEGQMLVNQNAVKPASEEELRGLLKSPERISAGKVIFDQRCTSCHGAKGQGGIGPNLTDEYWLHGGRMTEIAQTVRNGVPAKGMPPWGPLLSQDEIYSVVAYIKSIRGTHPEGAKGPEGEWVKE